MFVLVCIDAMWRCNDYGCELHPWCAGKAQAPPVHENILFVHLGVAFAATATPPTDLTLLSNSWTGAPERTAATATVTRLSSTPSSTLLLPPLPSSPSLLPLPPFNRLRYSSSPRTQTELADPGARSRPCNPPPNTAAAAAAHARRLVRATGEE